MPAFHEFFFTKSWRRYQWLWKSIIWPIHSTKVPQYVFSLNLLAAFLKILILGFPTFFWMLLRIYNLPKLMQLKFAGRFILGLKGTKNGVFWAMSWLFWGLILNKILCNSHCNQYSFAFALWLKMLLTNHIVRFLKL